MAELRTIVYAACVAVAMLPLFVSLRVGWRTEAGKRGIWTALAGVAIFTAWYVLSSPRS